jgi:hypothetical protein
LLDAMGEPAAPQSARRRSSIQAKVTRQSDDWILFT